jgi:hypothetical protein
MAHGLQALVDQFKLGEAVAQPAVEKFKRPLTAAMALG